MDVRTVIKELPAFAGVSEREIERLVGITGVRRLRRRETLFMQGDEPAGLHIVLSGWLKVVRSLASGREVVLDVVGPLEALGPCCGGLTGRPHPCSAIALGPTQVLSARGTAWKAVARECPALAAAAAELLMGSRRRCVDLAVGLALQDIDGRLASLLLRLSGDDGQPGGGPRDVPPLLNQEEMACAIGTAREVVTRHIGVLVSRGILARRGRRIVITQPGTLHALAADA